MGELLAKCKQLEREKTALSNENRQLTSENRFLVEVNGAFANENDELREKVDRTSKIRLPKSMRQQDDDSRPSKRTKAKSKGKKAVHCTDDELEADFEDNSNLEVNELEEERNEKGARVCFILIDFLK